MNYDNPKRIVGMNNMDSCLLFQAKSKITPWIIDLKDEDSQARGTRVVFGVPV